MVGGMEWNGNSMKTVELAMVRRIVGVTSSLTMSAVSSSVLSTLLYALREERHFALVVGLRVSNLGSL